MEAGAAFPEIEEEKLSDAVERFEAHVIKETLEKHQYNRTKTAKALGISIRNLYYKMDKYNLAKIACNKLQNECKIMQTVKQDHSTEPLFYTGTKLA